MEAQRKSKSKRGKRGKSKISFDEEVVTKDHAKELVAQEKEILLDRTQTKILEKTIKKTDRKKKHKQIKDDNEKKTEDCKETTSKKKRQKLSKDSAQNVAEQVENPTTPEVSPQETVDDKKTEAKKESIRSLKRKKHEKLMGEKKLKVELDCQQKALNYLSKWKHSKSEWKFEKLRQVWLQQNLFDTSKIPNEFWDTVVEYFSGAKGGSRQAILDLAIKLIEGEEKCLVEDAVDADEEYQIKLKRARDIVQNLE